MSDDLERALQLISSRHALPGMAAYVYYGDAVEQAYVGLGRVDEVTSSLSPKDFFQFASCGKAITAYVLMETAREAGISLDCPLKEILANKTLLERYQEISLAEILTHSAGLPYQSDNTDLFSELYNLDKSEAPQIIRERIVTRELLKTASEGRGSYRYSNYWTYTVAGYCAEHISGKPYESLAHELLGQRLGETNWIIGRVPEESVHSVPSGHLFLNEKESLALNQDLPLAMSPSGVIRFTLPCYAAFMRSISTDGRFFNKELRKHDVLIPNRGMRYTVFGLGTDDDVYTHRGTNNFNCMVIKIYPRLNAGIIVTTNHGGHIYAPNKAPLPLEHHSGGRNRPSFAAIDEAMTFIERSLPIRPSNSLTANAPDVTL